MSNIWQAGIEAANDVASAIQTGGGRAMGKDASGGFGFGSILVAVIVIGIAGFVMLKKRDQALKERQRADREAERRREAEQKELAARARAEELKTLEAEIARQAAAYRDAFYHYALYNESFVLDVGATVREELKTAYQARETQPAFGLTQACQQQGFSATLIAEALNAYLKGTLGTPAEDSRIPAATLEKLLQKEAVEKARATIGEVVEKTRAAARS